MRAFVLLLLFVAAAWGAEGEGAPAELSTEHKLRVAPALARMLQAQQSELQQMFAVCNAEMGLRDARDLLGSLDEARDRLITARMQLVARRQAAAKAREAFAALESSLIESYKAPAGCQISLELTWECGQVSGAGDQVSGR